MKKIIVIGCPGSGKSRLSKELHNITAIPLYHLDMMYWNSDKTKVERSLFLGRLSDALKGEKWIIDGNYISTMEQRMAACDTVIYLDYPTEVCLDGIRERRGKPRSDMPWIETEEDAEFVEFVKGYNAEIKPGVLALIERYKHEKRVVVLTSREEADKFLRAIAEA